MVTLANDPASNVRDLPEPLAEGLSVRDLLAQPGLAGATVLAGRAGLDRIVRGANVMEVPDILPWVKADELLLTTGFPLTRAADTDAGSGARLLDLLPELDRIGLSALAIKLGRYLSAVPEPVLRLADQLGFPLLRLADDAAFDEVLSGMFGVLLRQQNEVLAQADALHQAISAIVLGGGGLPQIAREVSRLLDCVVLITTPDGRVLADEGHEPHRSAIRELDVFDASGRLRTERLRIGVHPVPGGVRAASGSAGMSAIVAGGVDHGRIVAYRLGAGLLPGSMQALERVAIVAALTITKELAVAAVEGKFRGDYLRDVLTGLLPADDQVVEHCRSLGWEINRPMVVVVAELDPAEVSQRAGGAVSGVQRSQHERFASAWQQVLRAHDKTAPVVAFSREVVALLPVRSADSAAAVDGVVAAVSGDRGGGRHSFCAGVSRLVSAPADIAAGYAQARKAVQVGRRVHGHGSVSHFDSLGVHRLLSLVPDAAELKSFAADVLADLAADSPDAADLRATLQTLLDTNLNVAETARLLHFHYNTLRYRIGKLERIVGPFTTDPHLRLDVALALQVVQMRGI
ncbi:PucR family transcriptional regulator [Jatrophihabitans lederbergiae]|uniref:PucR family transcriptional regulator ligand-binding domain-containing protein n=1 Tax=Jatrophihabitans lederbergiae TaxID=3075547 RepID=A0ABU2J5P7_9ACTN|nr:PucR family transcriptional regulator ligand-binding domain-containing protein [Jatrophihabitans sp. DSM 44399]MDT0260023.1 PucR family transcriptional regulator ligand-binding domain-containing protein [Jatrophihabitans sp. DSM 44399]